jgi:hypothetical protein
MTNGRAPILMALELHHAAVHVDDRDGHGESEPVACGHEIGRQIGIGAPAHRLGDRVLAHADALVDDADAQPIVGLAGDHVDPGLARTEALGVLDQIEEKLMQGRGVSLANDAAILRDDGQILFFFLAFRRHDRADRAQGLDHVDRLELQLRRRVGRARPAKPRLENLGEAARALADGGGVRAHVELGGPLGLGLHQRLAEMPHIVDGGDHLLRHVGHGLDQFVLIAHIVGERAAQVGLGRARMQKRANHRVERRRREVVLVQIAVGAGLQPKALHVGDVDRGHEQRRHVPGLLQRALEQRKRGFSADPEIEDHQVEMRGGERLARAVDIGNMLDAKIEMARTTEQFAHQRGVGAVILDEQHVQRLAQTRRFVARAGRFPRLRAHRQSWASGRALAAHRLLPSLGEFGGEKTGKSG